MDEEKLLIYIEKKKEKQIILDARLNEIEDINLDLFSDNIGKSMSNFGSQMKGLYLLLISISFAVCSMVLLVKPALIAENISFLDTPREKAIVMVDELTLLLPNLILEKDSLEKKLELDYETDLNLRVRIICLFILLLSFYLFSKRKHLKALRERNNQIKKSNKITQEIITEYKQFVVDNKQEHYELENILRR